MKYFQYTNTVRDLDNKIRPWEDYDALCYSEIYEYNDNNSFYYHEDMNRRAEEIKDEERIRKIKISTI